MNIIIVKVLVCFRRQCIYAFKSVNMKANRPVVLPTRPSGFGWGGGGGYKCQLSVKSLAICQLSVKFKAICQLSVNWLLIIN